MECGKFSVGFGEPNLTADSAKQNFISRASRVNLVKFDSFASRPQNRVKFDALKSLASQLTPSP
ncbi:hypothetical protein CSHOW_1700 [Campylobacter showae]|uniref:Uncharacterized protein n=1 Tax=Campylobacter showae RM3277 TaxID=553219 RepID=C6RHN0_9BACT|nr:hypothetical protein CAMSH0001_0857 [Campylobacter showae RM3277]QCD49601.1 hypothetical protein CSHOW_1700 [Campylobacter showae]